VSVNKNKGLASVAAVIAALVTTGAAVAALVFGMTAWLGVIVACAAAATTGLAFASSIKVNQSWAEAQMLNREAERLASGDISTLEAGSAELRSAINDRLDAERAATARAQDEATAADATARDAQAVVTSLGGAVAFARFDAAEVCQEASGALSALLGISATNLVGRTHNDVIGLPLSHGEATTMFTGPDQAEKSILLTPHSLGDGAGWLVTYQDDPEALAADAERQAALTSFANASTAMVRLTSDGSWIEGNSALEAVVHEAPDSLGLWAQAEAGLSVPVLGADADGHAEAVGQLASGLWNSEFIVGERTIRVQAQRTGFDEIWAELSDITARQGDAAMAAAAEAGSVVATFRADGSLISANDAFIALLGHSTSPIDSLRADDLLTANATASWSGASQGVASTGTFELQHKDGTACPVRGAFHPTRDVNGNVVSVTLVAANVSAEIRRALSGEAKRAAISRAQPMITFNPAGHILAANHLAADVLGIEQEQAKGSAYSDFIDLNDHPGLWDRVLNGTVFVDRMSWSFNDEQTAVVTATFCPVIEADGQVSCVICLARDITYEEQKRDELRGQAAVVEHLQDAVAIVDADGSILSFNTAAQELLSDFPTTPGVSFGSAIGESLITDEMAVEGHGAQSIRDSLREGLASSKTSHIRISGRTLRVIATPIDGFNGVSGTVMELADITQEMANEGLLRAVDSSQAQIEFLPDGTIETANSIFLELMKYTPQEVIGRHHRTFVDFSEVTESEYDKMWETLRSGQAISGLGKRLTKGGDGVYLQYTYMPVTDEFGAVKRVVKIAFDVTAIETEVRKNLAVAKRRHADQVSVIEQLDTGFQALAQGDLKVQLADHFPEDYKQLRYNFNDAVDRLRAADELRVKVAQDQDAVVLQLAQAMQNLADGVLTFDLADEFPAEYDQLRINFNNAVGRVRDAMQSITSTASGISKGAKEISQAADDLSNRTESQAATLEETAAALDEITATVRQTAEGATEANRMASETRDEATVSGSVVSDAVDAMGEIERSSTQINQIIGVIDDIAFQTNLLALNAGVEAARAGDAGRGFAVVAQEVRALAQRSSDAAKEIKELISTSAEQVSRGVELVDKAGTALSDIVKRVENVSSLVSEIAASAQEQSVSLVEVNTAMNKMDQVTQQNAAMVEQSTASSHELAKASAQLLDRVGHFNIGQQSDVSSDDFAVPDTKPAESASFDEGQGVHQQRQAAQAFFAGVGGAAEKIQGDDENWEEF